MSKKMPPAYYREWYWKNKERVDAKARERYKQKSVESFLLMYAKRRARVNEVPFNIDITDIVVPEHCPILGMKLERGEGKPRDHSPSLDRVIPELGYVKGNVRVISFRANSYKRDLTEAQLLKLLAYVRGELS